MEGFRPGTEPGASFGDGDDLESLFGDSGLFADDDISQTPLPGVDEIRMVPLLDKDGNPVLDEEGNPVMVPAKPEVAPEDEVASDDLGDTY